MGVWLVSMLHCAGNCIKTEWQISPCDSASANYKARENSGYGQMGLHKKTLRQIFPVAPSCKISHPAKFDHLHVSVIIYPQRVSKLQYLWCHYFPPPITLHLGRAHSRRKRVSLIPKDYLFGAWIGINMLQEVSLSSAVIKRPSKDGTSPREKWLGTILLPHCYCQTSLVDPATTGREEKKKTRKGTKME